MEPLLGHEYAPLMPRPSQDWTSSLRGHVRAMVKDAGVGAWSLKAANGRALLVVRDRREGRDGYESVALPYPWQASSAADVLARVRQIFKVYAEGNCTLKAASLLVASSSSHQDEDWLAAVAAFRVHRARVSDATWKAKYMPILSEALKVLAYQHPSDGTWLCDLALRPWPVGMRQRQILRQNLYGFLRFCVYRHGFRSCWLPPEVIEEHLKPKRVGFSLSDQQILHLLDSLPDDQAAVRWRYAIQLMAVYGLRPEELRYLCEKPGTHGPELWTTYRKSKGGRKAERTEPRRLHPLLLRDATGVPIEWGLLQCISSETYLPPLGQEGKAGEAVGTYLRRQTAWNSLRQQAEKQGEQLTPYTFRHRYAKRSHALGLPIANIAQAMGHTIEVHLQSYARFTPDATSELYARANG